VPRHKRIKSVPEDIKVSKDRICQCDYVVCILDGNDSLRVVSHPIPKNSQLIYPYCKVTIQYPLSTHLLNRSLQRLPVDALLMSDALDHSTRHHCGSGGSSHGKTESRFTHGRTECRRGYWSFAGRWGRVQPDGIVETIPARIILFVDHHTVPAFAANYQ